MDIPVAPPLNFGNHYRHINNFAPPPQEKNIPAPLTVADATQSINLWLCVYEIYQVNALAICRRVGHGVVVVGSVLVSS